MSPGDIYVSLKDVTQSADLLGAIARVPRFIALGRLTQDTVKLVFVDDQSPRDYIFWLLRTPQYREYCRAHATGTTNLGLSRKDFLTFPVPALTNKRNILVDLLQALDDKIDLNRRMNETLEAMARATFKDWFVDFGPTRAKMEGREPYLVPEIWELFPARLDGEGKPEGWRLGKLDEIVELNPHEPLRKGTITPYLDMSALPTSGPTPKSAVARKYTSGMRFRNNDTLFARITPCLENGKAAFVQCLPNGAVGWGSTEFIVLRSRRPVPAQYTYLLSREEAFRAYAIQSMTGTSGQQRARKQALAEYPVSIPDDPIWYAFGSILEPLFDRQKANGKESNTLAQLRDLLLPKLMSGEIRLREAEARLKEAV